MLLALCNEPLMVIPVVPFLFRLRLILLDLLLPSVLLSLYAPIVVPAARLFPLAIDRSRSSGPPIYFVVAFRAFRNGANIELELVA